MVDVVWIETIGFLHDDAEDHNVGSGRNVGDEQTNPVVAKLGDPKFRNIAPDQLESARPTEIDGWSKLKNPKGIVHRFAGSRNFFGLSLDEARDDVSPRLAAGPEEP